MARLGKFFYINGTDNLSNAHFLRVRADGGITESLGCIDTAGTLLESASYFMRPSGYKEDTVYSLIPNNSNGSLNFTRASDAWRTEIGGLVQRTPYNLLQQSETFENASWNKTNATVSANVTTAPNGTTTADKIVENSTNANHYINQSVTNTNGLLTYSIYAKASERTFLYVNAFATIPNNFTYQPNAFFDLANGTIGTTSSCNASIQSVGNGWYRCVIQCTSVFPSSSATVTFYNYTATANGISSYQGDGTSGIFVWGAQLVEGADQLPYFPTTDRLNVPRLDYTYGTCPALLLEPQRTNTLLYSNDFTNAVWVKDNSGATNPVVTANYGTSPDGSNNASRLQLNKTGGTFSRIYQYASAGAGTYSFTVYMKSNTGSSQNVGLRLESVGINCVVTTSWQRFTLNSTVSTAQAQIMLYDLISGNDETADILFYGAQLEAGAYPTTYIPTTTASATRIADSFSRNNIYTNGLITSSGGTWFVELRNNIAYLRDSSVGFGIGDTSGLDANALFLRIDSTSSARLAIMKRVSGSVFGLHTTTTDTTKIAIKWNGSTADVFVNGTKQVSATTFTATIMQFFQVATTQGVGVPLFIQQMALFNYPLGDSDCQVLTT